MSPPTCATRICGCPRCGPTTRSCLTWITSTRRASATRWRVQLYLKDIEDFRDRLSQYLICRIPDEHIANSIRIYNRGRELMKQLYELRKRERPPVTGAEALEVSKAAARMPRERFNELMEQLLDEIQRTGREIKKARR